MSLPRGVALLSLVILGVAVGSALGQSKSPAKAAGDSTADIKARVTKLLDTGWQPSLEGTDHVAKFYQRCAPLLASDARLPYAFTLVHIRHHQYASAIEPLDQVLASTPDDLAAWRLRIWLSMMTKDYAKAMELMPRFVERFQAAAGKADSDKEYAENAGFLGRMFGFMEGPLSDRIDTPVRTAAAQRVFEKLTSSGQQAFEAARKAVLRQAGAMEDESQISSAQAKESNAKVRAKTIEEFEDNISELANKLAQEKSRVEQFLSEAEKEAGQLKSQGQQIEGELRPFYDRAVGIQREVVDLNRRVAQLRDQASRERDGGRRNQLANDANNIQNQRNQRMNELQQVQRQGAVLANRGRALAARYRELDVRAAREKGAIQRMENALKQLQARKEKYQAQPADGSSPQASDQKGRLASLSAYVPMPISLESERNRVMKSFE